MRFLFELLIFLEMSRFTLWCFFLTRLLIFFKDDSNDVSQKATDSASSVLNVSANSLVGFGVLIIIVLVVGILIGRNRKDSPPPQSIQVPGIISENAINQVQMNQYPIQQAPPTYQYEVQQPPQIPSFDPGILK